MAGSKYSGDITKALAAGASSGHDRLQCLQEDESPVS